MIIDKLYFKEREVLEIKRDILYFKSLTFQEIKMNLNVYRSNYIP